MEIMFVAGGTTFVIGCIVMLIVYSITSSAKWHDQHHTHHSELMCGHCTTRTYHSGVSMGEAIRRWPMRIMGENPPKGEG
jgi:hypothetical protein